jgi:hypothetical protein
LECREGIWVLSILEWIKFNLTEQPIGILFKLPSNFFFEFSNETTCSTHVKVINATYTERLPKTKVGKMKYTLEKSKSHFCRFLNAVETLKGGSFDDILRFLRCHFHTFAV